MRPGGFVAHAACLGLRGRRRRGELAGELVAGDAALAVLTQAAQVARPCGELADRAECHAACPTLRPVGLARKIGYLWHALIFALRQRQTYAR